MKGSSQHPPRFFSRLVEYMSRRELNFSVLGDMEEDYFRILDEKGRRKAAAWYRFQVLSSLPRFMKSALIWRMVMLRNYILVALRNIRKHKGYSFINIFGLAVGMGICILIFVLISDEMSYDRFHENAGRLYRVIRVDNRDSDQNRVALTPAPLGASLKANYPEIEDAATFNFSGGYVRVGDEYFTSLRVGFTDPTFIRMFSFEFLQGNPESALDTPHSVVITDETSEKLFNGKNPIGQSLEFREQVDLMVTGVIRKPRNSHLEFEMIVPMSLHKEFDVDLETFDRYNYSTYVLLQENVRLEDVNKKIFTHLDSVYKSETMFGLELQPLTKIYLESHYDYDVHTRTSDIRIVYIFSIIAFLILLIACINFMNLATARSERRMREVGMRKVIGAVRMQIIRQFLTESILMASLAVVIAVLLVELFIPFFNHLLMKQMSFLQNLQIETILILMGFVLFTGFMAGSYPAFFLSASRPVNILKGNRKKGKNLMRKLLVTGQFSVSIILIIMTTVLYKQLQFMQHKKLGYDKERLVCLPLGNEVKTRYEVLKNLFQGSTEVESLTATQGLPTWQGSSFYLDDWEGRDTDKVLKMNEAMVDYDYFSTFGMKITQGRTFSPNFSADSTSSILINEEAARQMDMENPLGKHVGVGEDGKIIIGVVKDFHHDHLRNKINPMIFQLNPKFAEYFILRLSSGNLSDKLAALESKWKGVIQDRPFHYFFLEDALNRNYLPEITLGKAVTFFSTLAIFIAALGLFGLAAYTAEQRTKEIGIRKILGASVLEIIGLLSKKFALRVAVAGVIAVPLAFFAASAFLQNYTYRTKLGILVFILPVFAALALALLTVSSQAIRAALADPVRSLRYE